MLQAVPVASVIERFGSQTSRGFGKSPAFTGQFYAKWGEDEELTCAQCVSTRTQHAYAARTHLFRYYKGLW